jgi:hypothetical protein
MNDEKKRFCSGCFTLIAPFEREAFGAGGQWFHNGNCQRKMLDRDYQIYHADLNREALKQAAAA